MLEPRPLSAAARLAGSILCVLLAGCINETDGLAPASPSTPFRAAGDPTPAQTLSGARDFSLPKTVAPPIGDTESVEPGRVYGLADLVDIAQTTNPQTRVSWEQARQAATAVGITKALYLPVVTRKSVV